LRVLSQAHFDTFAMFGLWSLERCGTWTRVELKFAIGIPKCLVCTLHRKLLSAALTYTAMAHKGDVFKMPFQQLFAVQNDNMVLSALENPPLLYKVYQS
jgi:hypothetical protein